jgi:hypothetical protein
LADITCGEHFLCSQVNDENCGLVAIEAALIGITGVVNQFFARTVSVKTKLARIMATTSDES